MNISIVIPAKGISKRVKNKNLYKIRGKSLIRLACEKVLMCKTINNFYLDTEDDFIIRECQDLEAAGLQILKRPRELATNKIDANDMLVYALHSIDYTDVILQTFATSPLITSTTIDKCVDTFINSRDYDSFLTVINFQEYLWKDGIPENFDLQQLPNSFELEPFFMETHGLYGIYTNDLLRLKRRVGNFPLLIDIPKLESFDIDTQEDLEIVERLLCTQE